MKARKRRNCISNVIRFDNKIEIGTVSRGKYTFPNMFACEVKTLDVLVRHAEK